MQICISNFTNEVWRKARLATSLGTYRVPRGKKTRSGGSKIRVGHHGAYSVIYFDGGEGCATLASVAGKSIILIDAHES